MSDQPSGDLHWRNTQKPARFWFMDARGAVFLLLFLVHMRIWTLVLAILSMIVFYVLERAGLTFEAALRAIRSYILGRNRPANHRRSIRRRIDFEAVDE